MFEPFSFRGDYDNDEDDDDDDDEFMNSPGIDGILAISTRSKAAAH